MIFIIIQIDKNCSCHGFLATVFGCTSLLIHVFFFSKWDSPGLCIKMMYMANLLTYYTCFICFWFEATIIQEAQERFCDVLSGPSTHEKKTRFKRASKEPERPPKVKKMKVTDTHEEV
jgi:hypothetical protein